MSEDLLTIKELIDFVILLQNWLNHKKKTLTISVDILYDEYLSPGIEIFALSEYKYGKDLQKWFDSNLLQPIHSDT